MSNRFFCFLKKALFFIIGQVICLFLYPLCWVMNIRFIPVNYAVIGHLALEVDCYLKEGILGLHPQYKTILPVFRKDTANAHLLSYWKKYVYIMDNPLLFALLWGSLRRNKFLSYNMGNYLTYGKDRAGNFMTRLYPSIQKQYYGRSHLLSLTDFDRKRGWETLCRIGVPENAWFVCVHCREKGYGYRRGREPSPLRDVTVSNYFPAIQEIVDRGGWVIRIGDPSMSPIPKMKNVIDYAHLDIKSDWMDIFLCAACKFFLGSNSGISLLANVFGVRTAIANMSGPISAVLLYGQEDIGIHKLVWSIREKRYLSFEEIFSSPVANFPDEESFTANGLSVIENSPEDIKDLAIEMMESMEGRLKYTEEDERLQKRFKSLMNSTHYSTGAISRVGRDFLRKYDYLYKNQFIENRDEVVTK